MLFPFDAFEFPSPGIPLPGTPTYPAGQVNGVRVNVIALESEEPFALVDVAVTSNEADPAGKCTTTDKTPALHEMLRTLPTVVVAACVVAVLSQVPVSSALSPETFVGFRVGAVGGKPPTATMLA